MAIGLALTAAQLGLQGYRAIKARQDQKKAEEELGKMTLPTTETEEYKRNLAASKAAEQEGLPEASYQRQKEAIDQSTAQAGEIAKQGNLGLAAIPGMMKASTGAYSDLISKDAQARQQAKDRTAQIRAGMDQRKYEQSSKDYDQRVASGQAMLGAAKQQGAAAMDQGLAIATTAVGSFDKSGEPMDYNKWSQMTPEEQAKYKEFAKTQQTSPWYST